MKWPLTQAELALDSRFGAGAAERYIVRVEARAADDIVLTTSIENQSQWFRWTGERLVLLDPAADTALPFVRAQAGGMLDASESILAWRPGRRIVLREDGGIRKGYKKGRLALACERHRRAVQALAGAESAELFAPSIASEEPATESWLMSAVPGEPMLVCSSSVGSFARVGRGLRALAGAPVEGLTSHGPREEIEVLTRTARRGAVVHELPTDFDDALDELRQSIDAGMNLGSRVPSVLVHRDLHDGQLIRSDGRVAVLDFDLAAAGDAALDLGNLTAHLQLRALQRWRGATQAGAEACATALIEGYAPGSADAHARIRWYQASTFLRLALVYDLRPRWRHLTSTLISMSRRCARQVFLDPIP